MGLWGNSNSTESRPKFLPIDSNASGSTGAREDVLATIGGWGLAPGLAASGNDNKDAQPEVLVCIRNLAGRRGSPTVQSIDWTQGVYADADTFDITVTFDEAIDITSAAASANQTVTNKAYILLSRVGATDLVEDNTIACQYHSGSGTNRLTFRGVLQTAAAGFIGFNGAGVGDDATAGEAGIVFDGSSTGTDEKGNSMLAMLQEGGTVDSPADRIVLDSTAAIVATVNGALTQGTTLVLDAVSGTLAVGQKIYGQNNATPLTDAQGSTALSQDGSLTITAVGSQTSVTVSEPITVANDVILNFAADGHDELQVESLSFTLAGVDGASNVMTGIPFTGGDSEVSFLLEEGAQTTGEDHLILDASDGSSTDENDNLVAEDKTSDIAVYEQAGSTSGSAFVLNGVTTT